MAARKKSRRAKKSTAVEAPMFDNTKFETEADARTLEEAEVIRGDRGRKSRAMGEIRKKAAALTRVQRRS